MSGRTVAGELPVEQSSIVFSHPAEYAKKKKKHPLSQRQILKTIHAESLWQVATNSGENNDC